MSRRSAPPERLELLRQLMAQGGLSWAQIGKQLGVSKNSVAGMIRRHVFGKQNHYRNPANADRPPRQKRAKQQPAPAPVVVRPAPVLWAPPPPAPPSSCQWPTTDERPWLFCEAPCEPGAPYCAAHCRVAFPRWPAVAA